MTKLQLLLFVSLATACSKSNTNSNATGADKKAGSTNSASASGKKQSSAIDPSKFGGACNNSFDCPKTDFDSACRVDCQRPTGTADSEPGYCQLIDIVANVGAPNCYGNRRGVDSQGESVSTKVPVIAYCDIDAGVFCNMGTHACEAVKAIDAACESSDECGKDGACKDKRCVAAGAPGAAAVERRCTSAAYRDGDQCVARKPNGQACKESNECQSFNCSNDGSSQTCKDAKPAACVLR
jgi:hypothetical protein